MCPEEEGGGMDPMAIGKEAIAQLFASQVQVNPVILLMVFAVGFGLGWWVRH